MQSFTPLWKSTPLWSLHPLGMGRFKCPSQPVVCNLWSAWHVCMVGCVHTTLWDHIPIGEKRRLQKQVEWQICMKWGGRSMES